MLKHAIASSLLIFSCATHLSAADSFLETDGIVVIEAESTKSNYDLWETRTDISNYSGAEHLEFTGNNEKTGSAKSPLDYTFHITEAGTYRVIIRSGNTPPSGTPKDQANDCYIKMDGDFTPGGTVSDADLRKNQKYFAVINSSHSWNWAEEFDLNNNHDFHNAEYTFKAGEKYTLTISGRSRSFNIDRIVIFKTDTYTLKEAKDLSLPESQELDSGNLPPAVDTGADITLANEVTTTTLDATVSDDGKPNASLTYTWSQEGGPTTATINSSNSEDTSVELPQPGRYVFKLSIYDGDVTISDEVVVSREAEADDIIYAINCGGDAYTSFDGIAYEADNYSTSGDSYTATNTVANTEDDALFQSERYAKDPKTVDYAFPVSNGGYQVTLMWSENGNSGRLMNVDIEGSSQASRLDVVELAGAAETAYEETFTVNVADGSLDLKLSSHEDATEKFANVMGIRIATAPEGENIAPTVSAGPDIEEPATTEMVSINANVSDDGQPSGSLTYTWSQIDGPDTASFGSPNSEDTTVTLPAEGFYTFRLTVDDGELSSSDDVKVSRWTEQNLAPEVNAGTDGTLAYNVSGFFLDATVSDDGLPSKNLTYTWTQESGPDATISSANSVDTGLNLPESGTYLFRLTVSDGELSTYDEVSVTRQTNPGPGPLEGQIIVDPDRGNYFVRNQDLNDDGQLDPFMMAGVGGPEQFLYLGKRQEDGTRSGTQQQNIIDELIASGANGIYLQSIRTFGGDAGSDKTQAPFNDYNDPESGLDPDIMAQWHGWFGQMRDANIGILFFIYDDHTKPWGSSGDSVPSGEESFLTAITNEFKGYPNIIFVMAEEYQFAGFSTTRMSNMAAIVAAADDHDHALGVHHNIGLANQYVGDPNINVFVQQADLRGKNPMDDLHTNYGTDQGFDEDGTFAYIMGEGFGYHQDIVGKSSNRDELRQSLYATAMAGGITTVFGAYESEWGRDPTINNLEDMGRLVEFFHTTPFNTMDHNDALAHGDTDWVKADVNSRYIAYSLDAPTAMGVKNLPEGVYNLRWYDAKEGEWVFEYGINASGDTAFTAPAEMNNDTVLEIIRFTGNSPAPKVDAGSNLTVEHDQTTVQLKGEVIGEGSYILLWTQESGPSATINSPNAAETSVTLSEAGTYVFRLTANDGQFTFHDSVTVNKKPDLGDVIYAINCGGKAHTAADGTPFEADNYFSTGDTHSVGDSIAGTTDDALFQTERYIKAPGTIDYAFPVSDGSYKVTLMWSENTGSGRLMDVTAEGTLVIDGLDVETEAGAKETAYTQSLTVDITDGTLNISIGKDAAATENYPNIMAILIEKPSEPGQSRRIEIMNIGTYLWTINPDSGTTDDTGSSTVFDELQDNQDYMLIPSPSAGG